MIVRVARFDAGRGDLGLDRSEWVIEALRDVEGVTALYHCLAEDGRSPQNTQSETTVAVRGQQIVSAYNDTTTVDLQHGNPLAVGYSVSTDGGAHFVDMGALPTGGGTAFAYSDPSVVRAIHEHFEERFDDVLGRFAVFLAESEKRPIGVPQATA